MQEDKGLSKKQKKERAKADKQRQTARKRIIRRVGIAAAVLLAVGVIALVAVRMLTRPGERVASLGAEHVRASAEVSYNSNPPTSGPHTGASSGPGIYESAPGDKPLIHSLEHGYVIISYNCAESAMPCGELRERLEAVARGKELWKLIVTPRESLDVPIALTAWTRIDKIEAFDRRRIERFIDAWRDKGPEPTPN